MEIIKESMVNHDAHYEYFEYADCPGAGFMFPCDKDGNVFEHEHPEAGMNYRDCLKGEVDGHAVRRIGVMKFHDTYREPAVGLCVCGSTVELGGFTNTCECGREYNWGGQELAPRSCWGEETGESWTDIINGGELDD